jgi:Uma2 family endonuclease
MAPRGSKNWTYDDYLELPDIGCRYEIMYGVLYADGRRITRHQLRVIRLWKAFALYAEKIGRGYVWRTPIQTLTNGAAVQPDFILMDTLDSESTFWLVDDRRKSVRVYRRVGKSLEKIETMTTTGDKITTPVLPGFALDVREIFEIQS